MGDVLPFGGATTALLPEPATDWTGQTYEERLILCAETLFVHGLIGAPAHAHITRRLRAGADRQREHRARCQATTRIAQGATHV